MTTATAIALESIVADLGADQLAHLAASLQARAAERRKVITVDEAWASYNAVNEIPGWQWGGFKECGQVRKAVEVLVGWRGLHPEQVEGAMTEVAFGACSHWAGATEVVARAAVAAGVVDGMAYREGTQDDVDV